LHLVLAEVPGLLQGLGVEEPALALVGKVGWGEEPEPDAEVARFDTAHGAEQLDATDVVLQSAGVAVVRW